jgi:RNA polymerase sigma-70 factor, ECF subfamily
LTYLTSRNEAHEVLMAIPSPSPTFPVEPPNLERLLEEHRSRLVAMVSRRIEPSLTVRFDADDVVNDAYLRAHERWETVRGRPDFSPFPWLYQLARDCLTEAWRRETRHCRDFREQIPWPDASSVQMGLSLVGSGTSPSAAAHRADVQQRMREALAHLADADREVLCMRHFDNLTHVEAAEVLGIHVSAASLRYLRALERLRRLWVQLYPQEGR